MASNRLFSYPYINESTVLYFDDAKFADFLLAEEGESLLRAIKNLSACDKAVKGRDVDSFAELNDLDVLDIVERGELVQLQETFEKFCEAWPEDVPDEDEVDELPSYSELIKMFRAYSQRERKQLWDMMDESLRERVAADSTANHAVKLGL